MKDSIKPNTLDIIKENLENIAECISTGGNFLNRTLITQAIRATINKWNIMKLKCSVRQEHSYLDKKQPIFDGDLSETYK